MYLEEFPSCCGANVLTEIYPETRILWYEDGKRLKHPKKVIISVSDGLKKQKRDIKHRTCFIILNKEQQEEHEEEILKFGFKPLLKDFYNPGHRSYLTLYVLERPAPVGGKNET